jgi:ketosteroid isomerase-like protein
VRLISFVLIAIALSAATVRAAAETPSAEGVRAAEQARAAALLKADTTAISKLTADDFVEISRLGTLRTKADNLRDIASGNLKLLTVQYDSTNVRRYGDVAVLRAIANNTGMFHGTPFAGRVWYTRVFVWRDGRWQAVTMQQTPIP